MKYLRKLPGSVRHEPGLERSILRKLPLVLAGGTFVPLFFAIGHRLFPPDTNSIGLAAHLTGVDILAIGMGVSVWMISLTVAIGSVMVVFMKGPAYVADAYHLVESDAPRDDLLRHKT